MWCCSATLDVELFRNFFTADPKDSSALQAPAPPRVIRVKGRQHPVQILYAQEAQTDYIDACVVAVLQLHLQQPKGDVLVFLTGPSC
jgi:pre-mRNA-splicing factor ATP-dependent RNA helicase DHX16